MPPNRICKDLEIKHLGEYHVFSSNTLLADLFETFRNMFINICEPEPAKFLSALGLAWQTTSKKAKQKLDLLTNIDMLLMVEKGIRGGICRFIYRCAKSNNKYMKEHDKNKESSNLQYWNVNNLYGWAMSQKLPVNNFEWTKDTSQLNEDFIKNCNEDVGTKHLNDFKGFISYSNNVDDIYKNIEEYYPNKKCKILIVFNDIIVACLIINNLIQ